MTGWAPITNKVIDKGFGGSRNGDPINGIVIHHVAGTNGLNYVANSNTRNSHPTYHIDNKGKVTGIVHPNRRPYSTAGRPDSEAITVEIDNSKTGGDWPISSAAYNSLIEIIVWHQSQSKRKGFAKNKPGVAQKEFFIAWHQQYVATACPGPYLIKRMDKIVNACKAKVEEQKKPVDTTPEPDTITIANNVPGYNNANDAVNSSNRVTVVAAGTYYVYKEAYGMINLSTKINTPGAWTNPNDYNTKPAETPEPDEEQPELEIPDITEPPIEENPEEEREINVPDNTPTETPNVVIENPNVRKVIYTVVSIVGLGLAATSTGFGFALTSGAIDGFPLWLGIANAVYPVVGAGIGYTASKNTPE